MKLKEANVQQYEEKEQLSKRPHTCAAQRKENPIETI